MNQSKSKLIFQWILRSHPYTKLTQSQILLNFPMLFPESKMYILQERFFKDRKAFSNNNLYLRFSNRGLKKYYVQQSLPTINGVTLYHGSQKIFFKRIPTRFWTSAPLSLLKNSVFYDPKDSTTILDTEFSLLSQKMPQDLHNKLTSLLQDISD